jgi:16S rRNA (cytidine1402-2'-O)-methyltransferase
MGKLSIVGTPIGNLQDITLRALETLRRADLIAAEDTRHTQHLLAHFDIRKPLVSFHEFNEAKRVAELLEKLQKGAHIAVVSDAGMPAISDPGARLVRAAADANIEIEIVPGPSALISALVASGFPADSFTFVGFLPYKSTQRRKKLEQFRNDSRTLVFYESPHRIAASLRDMRDVLGSRRAIIAREMTKKFEEILRGTLDELSKNLETRRLKGEITVVVEGAT